MISKVSVPNDEKNYLFFRNIKNEADGKTKKKQSGKLSSLNFKNKSVYEQYRERIEKGLSELGSRENRNPQIQLLKQESEELKSSMLANINRLRLVREKS